MVKNNFTLGILIEHIKSDSDKPYSYLKKNLLRSLEVESFIYNMAQINSETYLINLLDKPLKENGTIDVYKASDDSIINIPVQNIDLIFAGQTGQKFYNIPDNNSLSCNLGEICSFFDEITMKYPSVVFSNPVDTMLKFVSKDYLFELQNDGIPISKHLELKEINSIEDFEYLRDVSNKKNLDFVIKPKIAERGNGSYILSDLDNSKIIELLEQNVFFKKNNSNSTYAKISNRQGLFAQAFNEDFLTHGEKKIFFIDGEITVARRNKPEQDALKKYGISLNFRNGLREEIYTPTKQEINFVYEVAAYLKSKKLDFDYFRLDIVGDGTRENTFLNELELFNPCSSAGHNILNSKNTNPSYSKKAINNHNKKLLDTFNKSLEKAKYLNLEKSFVAISKQFLDVKTSPVNY